MDQEHGAGDEPADVAQPRHLAAVLADGERVDRVLLQVPLQEPDDASELLVVSSRGGGPGE